MAIPGVVATALIRGGEVVAPGVVFAVWCVYELLMVLACARTPELWAAAATQAFVCPLALLIGLGEPSPFLLWSAIACDCTAGGALLVWAARCRLDEDAKVLIVWMPSAFLCATTLLAYFYVPGAHVLAYVLQQVFVYAAATTRMAGSRQRIIEAPLRSWQNVVAQCTLAAAVVSERALATARPPPPWADALFLGIGCACVLVPMAGVLLQCIDEYRVRHGRRRLVRDAHANQNYATLHEPPL
jgi:hypothetical protein